MESDAAAAHFRSKLAFETDAWDLNEMLRAGENVVVIDARSEAAFAQEHIPHAINFPHRKMNREATKQLDRDTLHVTYCDGIGCNASTKGALKLAELGFQVKELIGGIEWWKRDGYPTESALVEIAP
ncbi:MAG TPA: rhodanese-like domain-containing protein [Lacipirellulaceae bacterium]|jgi:rhodanese-related sulfurtransferase|nr:rhodanese-like domain-containing protein [Lacipirellulaceae bacterium]